VDWLADASERSIREAVAAAAPDLAGARLERVSRITTSNPEWCTGTAIVAGSFLVKFAWSEPSAVRVLREAHVLAALADTAPGVPVPRLVGATDDPSRSSRGSSAAHHSDSRSARRRSLASSPASSRLCTTTASSRA
jgi:hypothetical protein